MDLQFNEPLIYKIYTIQVRLFLNENKWLYLLLTFPLTLPLSQKLEGCNREKSNNKKNYSNLIYHSKIIAIFVVIREIFLWSIFELWVSLIAKEIL